MQAATKHGSALDWGADVTLTPFAMARLSRELGYGNAGLAAAPVALYAQATLRGDEWRPPVGSLRAAVMVAAMIAHAAKK